MEFRLQAVRKPSRFHAPQNTTRQDRGVHAASTSSNPTPPPSRSTPQTSHPSPPLCALLPLRASALRIPQTLGAPAPCRLPPRAPPSLNASYGVPPSGGPQALTLPRTPKHNSPGPRRSRRFTVLQPNASTFSKHPSNLTPLTSSLRPPPSPRLRVKNPPNPGSTGTPADPPVLPHFPTPSTISNRNVPPRSISLCRIHRRSKISPFNRTRRTAQRRGA